jgi:hypothetical protein
VSAVTARWDGFLNNIRERFLEIMQEAKEGCPALLEESNLDPIPMGNAWGAIEMRAKQLETKIEETWSSQVERAFEQDGAPPQFIAHERAKGDALRDFIEVERERTRIAIYSDAGRAIFRHAATEIARSFACVRCGAPLEVPFTFRALNVHCQHCRTVNGYEPGTRLRLAEICIHPLCEEAAWQQWLVMHQAENAWRQARPVTIHHLKGWERAQIAYYHAYLSTRVRLLPDTAQAFDADLRGRMRQFYESMERERPWTLAGRPRDLV